MSFVFPAVLIVFNFVVPIAYLARLYRTRAPSKLGFTLIAAHVGVALMALTWSVPWHAAGIYWPFVYLAVFVAIAFLGWIWGPVGAMVAVPILILLYTFGQRIPLLSPLASMIGPTDADLQDAREDEAAEAAAQTKAKADARAEAEAKRSGERASKAAE